MRVLIVNAAIEYSTGKVIKGIVEELLENNNEVCIAYARGKKPNFGTMTYKIGTNFDVKIHALLARVFDSQGLHSKIATKKFIKFVNFYKPDVINLHNIHGYYLNYSMLFKFLSSKNIKVVWTLHDAWVVTGHCAYFDFVNCDKWKSKCFKCPGKKEYPKSVLFDRSEKNYNLKKELFSSLKNLILVTPSKWLENIVLQSKLQNYKVVTINNGIDLSVFKSTKDKFIEDDIIQGRKILLGVASLWNKRKGYSTFVELDKLIDHDRYVIVLVGLSNNQITELPSSIIGIKRTNNQKELSALYSQSEFFINPTLEDNYPTVNIEAVACGTPIIAFNTGGCKEIADLGCGIITNEKNAKSIYDCLVKYEKKDFTFNCEQKRDLFEQKRNFREYLKLFNSEE